MKRTSILLFFICLSAMTFGQTKMNQVEINTFKSAVKSQAEKITTVSADFEETKHVSVLKNPAQSAGIFRFKNEQLLWKYNAPKKSAMLFTKQKLTMKSDKGRTTSIDLNKNKRFKQLQQLMMGSYTGELFDETAFNISYFKHGNNRLAVMTPKTKEMAKHIQEVTLTFSNNENTVSEIKIVEKADDYSIIKLKNKKINTTINDSELTI